MQSIGITLIDVAVIILDGQDIMAVSNLCVVSLFACKCNATMGSGYGIGDGNRLVS